MITAAATNQVTSMELVTENFPMWNNSAGFSGTAGSASAAAADVAATNPLATISTNTKKQRFRIFKAQVEPASASPARRSDPPLQMPRREGRLQLQLDAHTKARFARLTNKILSPFLFDRQTLGEARRQSVGGARAGWLGGAIHHHRFLIERLELLDLSALFKARSHGVASRSSHLFEQFR